MDDLVEAAREASAAAYAPYSAYAVGAALEVADGTVFTGCNVENANYSESQHAETVALGSAVAAGHREFARLAVSTTARDGQPPCGACRQSLVEFCGPDFTVVCDEGDGTTTHRLGDLLPDAIGPEDLA